MEGPSNTPSQQDVPSSQLVPLPYRDARSDEAAPRIATSLLSCLPGAAALVLWPVNAAIPGLSPILGYAFGPLLLVGVIASARFIWKYRRPRGKPLGVTRPPLVELAMAVNVLVLLIGGPILLLAVAWFITGLRH